MNSLVSTVFNDGEGVAKFFDAMAAQKVPPEEIIIVDAGSTDGTWELLQTEALRADRVWRMVALQENGCNVARGRNLAIEAASGEIIVSTDIGCDWDPEWFEELVRPLDSNSQIDLVIGSWLVKKEDLHAEWALVEWAMKGDQKLEATANSYSSSRSIAYRKICWDALGRYPEDLTFAGDDALFHFLIEKAEVPRVGAPAVRCYWHRHETLKGFLKEAYRYGIGAGEAGIFLRDALLVGGRMVLEIGCLAGGVAILFFDFWIGLSLAAVGLVSFLARLRPLAPAVRSLRGEGVRGAWWKILVFVYATKWNFLKGVAQGWLAGNAKCRGARSRLAKMTREAYRENMRRSKIPAPLKTMGSEGSRGGTTNDTK
jgi:glycosyltransferase involved in cell wall biosynthesis